MLVGVLVVVLTTLRPGALQGASYVAYDNSIFSYHPDATYYGEFVPGLSQVGDEVVLIGTGSGEARTVPLSEFRLAYSAKNTPPSATVTVVFYANDGGVGVSGVPSPSTELWKSPAIPIESTIHTPFTIEYTDIVFNQSDFGNLVVPRHLTWAVQFAGFTPSDSVYAGLLTMSPPIIGHNYDTYWENIAGVWTLLQQLNSTPPPTMVPINFAASFTAVPDSTAFWDLPLSALLVLMVGGAIKRRHQSSVPLPGVV